MKHEIKTGPEENVCVDIKPVCKMEIPKEPLVPVVEFKTEAEECDVLHATELFCEPEISLMLEKTHLTRHIRYTLTAHLPMHSDEKPFQCSYWMKNHSNVNNESPWKCKQVIFSLKSICNFGK
ncbi:hypothetical protein L9F63_006048, partial [Diploptera punctata]